MLNVRENDAEDSEKLPFLLKKGGVFSWKMSKRQDESLRVVSLPLEEQACSSCLSNSRSLEIYRLCVFVFQPGAGPAGAPSAEFFCLGLCFDI